MSSEIKINKLQHNPEKDRKSTNLFYYGVLRDIIYLNGAKHNNVLCYLSEENTNFLNLLKFNNKKVEKRMSIDLRTVTEVTEKPSHPEHKKIQIQNPDNFYLAIQLIKVKQVLTQQDREKGKKLPKFDDEFFFEFTQEGTLKTFRMGLEKIREIQSKPILEITENIKKRLQKQNALAMITPFILQRNTSLDPAFLDWVLMFYNQDYQDLFTPQQVIAVFKYINIHYNLKTYFDKFYKTPDYASESPEDCDSCMTFEQFKHFQSHYQKETPYTDITLLQMLRQVDPDHDVRLEKISFYSFSCLMALGNSLLKDIKIDFQGKLLTDFFIFSEYFAGQDLNETIENSLKRGCIFFEFELIENNHHVPFFKIENQKEHATYILKILYDHVTTNDLPLIVSFDCQCSSAQQLELFHLIEKKINRSIFRGKVPQIDLLSQQIVFTSQNCTDKQLQSILYPAFSKQNFESLLESERINYKLQADYIRKHICLITSKEQPKSNFFNQGYQLIETKSRKIDHLIYLSLFQADQGRFQSLVEKPTFMNKAPFLYTHKDFIKIVEKQRFLIVSGFQLGFNQIQLEVSLHGIPQDMRNNMHYYSTIVENGFKPEFNLDVGFELRCPQMGMLVIKVFEKNFGSQDTLLSWVAVRFQDMNKGVRKIFLRGIKDFEIIPGSYLLIENIEQKR